MGKMINRDFGRTARLLTEAAFAGKPAEFALPQVLVRLSLEHDRMFNY